MAEYQVIVDEYGSKLAATQAADSAVTAKTSETNAAVSETNSKTSETNAAVSETNSKTSETNAAVSASVAQQVVNNGSAIFIAATVDAMKVADLQTGNSVKTLGYYTANDGGGAEYVIQDTTTEPASFYRSLNNGKLAVITNVIIHPSQVGYITDVTQMNTLANVDANWIILKNLLSDLKTSYREMIKFDTILTANRVYAEWISNRSCPVGFYSDSTTDGATTTDHVANTYNDTTFAVTINDSPNAYPTKLEEYIKLLHKSATPVRCYNGGFDSQSYQNGFGLKHWYNTWFRGLAGSNVDWSDVKMIVLGFGTSDSINLADTATVIDNYIRDLECTVIDCFLRGVQPVIQAPVLTTQHVGETVSYRNGNESVTIIETCQKQLCKKYNLEYFSLAEPLRQALNNFSGLKYSDFMSADMVHPNDKGHRLIAASHATKFNPNIVKVEDGNTIANIFPGHPAIIPTWAEIISPTSKEGNILKTVPTGYVADSSYYYNWTVADGNTKTQGAFLIRFPVYIKKPTALFYNNLENQMATRPETKNITIYSTLLSASSSTTYLVHEHYKQPEVTYSNKSFVTYLPQGLNIINVFANSNTIEQKLGSFYLGEIDTHFDCPIGRGTSGGYYATHAIKFDNITETYTRKQLRRKDRIKKYYDAYDNRPLEIGLTLEQDLAAATTYQFYTHYNDVQGQQDCYNLIEILGDTIALKIKTLSTTNTIFTQTIAGLNALLVKGAKIRFIFTSKHYNAAGANFVFTVNGVTKHTYDAAVNAVWTDGYGFDAPLVLCSNIYVTASISLPNYMDTLDSVL